MATITGARTTTNILSDQLAIDLGDKINELEPDVQALAIWTKAAGKQRTTATKFSWTEDKFKPRFDQVNNGAGITTTATTIVVDNGAYFAQWDQVLNTRTGEQFRVDGVASNTLTVTRGISGTIGTGIAMNDNDELLIIGSAQPENDTSKPARSSNPSKATNNTQIFRQSFEASGSLLASSFQVQPADWPHQANHAGSEHVKDIEYSLLFGRKSADTSGATEKRTTGGLLSFISTNQTDAGGDLSEAEWNAFMLQVMRYGSKSKLALASGVAVSALNKFPASKQQTRNDETTYGMDVSHFQTPFGSINLVYHKLFEGTKYGGYLIVVDLDQAKYRYLANDDVSRDTKVLPNRQPNDQDGRKDEYLTECGLQVGLESTHGVLTGITS